MMKIIICGMIVLSPYLSFSETGVKFMDKFAENNGTKINYRIWDNQNSSNKSVLLIHGALSSSKYWEENTSLISVFKQLGFEKICIINLRGHNKSDFPDNGFTVNDHLTDIESVVKNEKLDNFTMIGHSLGAAYTLGFALQSKKKFNISSFILGDYPPLVPPFSQEWLDGIIPDIDSFDIHPRLPYKLLEEIQFTDYRPHLSQIENSVLVIQGVNGGMLGQEGDEQFFSGLVNASFVKVPTGHDVFNSKETIDKIKVFLQ